MKTLWPRTPREDELFQSMSAQSKAAWRIVWLDGLKFGFIAGVVLMTIQGTAIYFLFIRHHLK